MSELEILIALNVLILGIVVNNTRKIYNQCARLKHVEKTLNNITYIKVRK